MAKRKPIAYKPKRPQSNSNANAASSAREGNTSIPNVQEPLNADGTGFNRGQGVSVQQPHVKRKRGRPPKKDQLMNASSEPIAKKRKADTLNGAGNHPKKRGRPPKNEKTVAEPGVKRKRGRPKKIQQEEAPKIPDQDEETELQDHYDQYDQYDKYNQFDRVDRFAEMEDSGDEYQNPAESSRNAFHTQAKVKQLKLTDEYTKSTLQNIPQTAGAEPEKPEQTKRKRGRPAKAQRNLSATREDGAQDDNDLVEERPRLLPKKANLSFQKVTTAWPLISDQGISQMFEIYENEGLSALKSLRAKLQESRQAKKGKRARIGHAGMTDSDDEEKVLQQFQQLQGHFYDQVYERMKYLPVPLITRKSHYDSEIMKNQNDRLESVVVPLKTQVRDLKREIEKEKQALKESERYLATLQKNSKDQLDAQRDLLRTRGRYLRSIDNDESMDDSAEQLNMMESATEYPPARQLYSDEEEEEEEEEDFDDYAQDMDMLVKYGGEEEDPDIDGFDSDNDELRLSGTRPTDDRLEAISQAAEDDHSLALDRKSQSEDASMTKVLARLERLITELGGCMSSLPELAGLVDEGSVKLNVFETRYRAN